MKTLLGAWRISLAVLREHLVLDAMACVVAALCLVLFAPGLTRSTESPLKLAAFANDEPAITMQLEAMTARPWGNPANFFLYGGHGPGDTRPLKPVPGYWGRLRYDGMIYYGGTYLDLAWAVFGPLHAMGVATFPTAPIILRVVCLLSGLGALLLLFGFGRRRASATAGFLAAVLMITDPGFGYYVTNIHPDTLQFFLGLAALVLGIQHAEQKDLASLAALGATAGLIQGTKAGGPWTVPFSVLALAMAFPWKGDRAWSEAFRRLGILGATALGFFFLSTPYAFWDRYYFGSMRIAYREIASSPLTPVSAISWIEGIASHLGVLGATVIVVGFCWAAWRAIHARDRAWALSLVLALSQIAWFTITGRLWVVPAYLLLAYGIGAVAGFDAALRSAEGIRERFGWHQRTTGGFAMALLAAIVVWRGAGPVGEVFRRQLLDKSTIVAVGKWAADSGVPHDSRIEFDDLSYFDPRVFPQAWMHGGVITWPDVRRERPEYLVLVSTLYEADWFKQRMAANHWEPSDPDPYNLRLYQDLLPATAPGPTGVPGVELVKILEPGEARCDTQERSAVLPRSGWSAAARMAGNFTGRYCDTSGPTIRVYHLQ